MTDLTRFGVGAGQTWAAHPQRQTILAELHARPFRRVETPKRVIHAAFTTDHSRQEEWRETLARYLLRHRGAPLADKTARHHHAELHRVGFSWESHGEFTTCAWEFSVDASNWFDPLPADVTTLIEDLPQPGTMLVSIDLLLVPDEGSGSRDKIEALFVGPALAASKVEGGAAIIATDFAADPRGFVRIVILDASLTSLQAGSLVKRLLEIETYRSFALLGLPKAQELSPSIRKIEEGLARVTAEIAHATDAATNQRLLDEITALSAELEAGASASLFRFGASRAYDELVQLRLEAIGEARFGDFTTWSSFLSRRLMPAMRTCQTTEERQANLSRKLTRAVSLLRTRVDLDLEKQNAEILRTMSDRSAMQLRLQQTVEGLSIAAISYYVIGIMAYIIKGAKEAGWLPVSETVAIAALVIPIILAITLIVRTIRRRGDKRAEIKIDQPGGTK